MRTDQKVSTGMLMIHGGTQVLTLQDAAKLLADRRQCRPPDLFVWATMVERHCMAGPGIHWNCTGSVYDRMKDICPVANT